MRDPAAGDWSNKLVNLNQSLGKLPQYAINIQHSELFENTCISDPGAQHGLSLCQGREDVGYRVVPRAERPHCPEARWLARTQYGGQDLDAQRHIAVDDATGEGRCRY